MYSRLIVLALAGCGFVKGNAAATDAADAPAIDASPASPGTLRWVRSLSSLEALGVADGAGGLVVSGALRTPANLGGQTLTPTGKSDLVVAGFDADTAEHLYSVRYGDTGEAYPFLRTVDSDGAPVLYGVSYGSVNLGFGPVPSGTPGVDLPPADGYVGCYGPATPSWVARVVGPGDDRFSATAPGPGSTVYGAGSFTGMSTLSSGQFTQTLTSKGGADIVLARFNTFTGVVDLVKTFGDTDEDAVSGAASGGGALVLAGNFKDTLTFGGAAPPITSTGGYDVWVAKLDASGGGIWAVRYGGAGDEREPRVAMDTAGDIYIAGTFTDQVGFGAVNLRPLGGADTFVAKLRGDDGSVAWATSLGTTGDDSILSLAVDRAGHVVVTGTVGAAFEGGPTAGGRDAFIASVETATGAPRWHKVFSTDSDDYSFSASYGRNGDVYALVGLGTPTGYDFGVPIIGAAGPAAVLLRIAP